MVKVNEVLDLTRELVNIPSITSESDGVEKIFSKVKEYLGPLVSYKKFEKNGFVSYLIGDITDMMNPTVLLNGHVDVVSASESEFFCYEKKGKLFGRGTGDMKGYVAAMMVAYKKWLQNGNSKGVSMLLTSDEEIGGFNGARYVLEQGLTAKIAFIPDGLSDFNVVASQKAPHHFHVRVTGKGGHASRAFELENPYNKLFLLYSDMKKKYACASVKNSWDSTFELTVVNQKNQSANQIPESISAWFSWRWPLEKVSFEEGVRDMKKYCKKYDIELLADGHGQGEGFLVDKESWYIKKWMKIVSEELKRKIHIVNEHGASDARHFYKFNIPVLVTSGIGGNIHASEEWVDVQSLLQLSNSIYIFLNKVV